MFHLEADAHLDLGRLPESGQSVPAPSRLGWVVLRRSASEPAFAEIGHSVFGLSWPNADRLLWAIETLKRTFASTQSRGSSRPKSVIARLLSHSRKQTFTVLPHRQNCAHCGRLAKRALPLQSGRRAGVRSRQLRVGKQTFKTVKALAAPGPKADMSNCSRAGRAWPKAGRRL